MYVLSSEESAVECSPLSAVKGHVKRGRSVYKISAVAAAKSAAVAAAKIPKTSHTSSAAAAEVRGEEVDSVTLSTPYITLDHYIRQVMGEAIGNVDDPGDCPHKTCPHCTGDMMLQ